ncbi:MAG: geranylgeranyl reductase family protein [Cuniculiplasma sp.]
MWKIAGAGIAGSFLYNRLTNSGFDVEIYDPKVENFYIPCGFATNKNLIIPYLKMVGIDFDQVCEIEDGPMTISGNKFEPLEVKNLGLSTIHKMRLEKLMVGDNVIRKRCQHHNGSGFIDATGISRALLPKPAEDRTMYAMEKICPISQYKGFYFYFFPRGRGYFWSFPLKGTYHVGAGGINLEEVKSYLNPYKETKLVSRKIRMKPIMENIFTKNCIGVGESIGYISPLLGEGIIPALESAEVLFQCIKSQDSLDEIGRAFRERTGKRMKEFQRLSNLVRKVQSGKIISFTNIFSLGLVMREMRNFGIGISTSKVLGHFL